MIIYTTKKGEQILLDDCDVDLLQYDWRITLKGYARCYIKRKTIYLSRLLLERKLGRMLLPGHLEEVDHIDLNKLNNQRYNLRVATSSQNNSNRKKFSGKHTSQYIGVYWENDRQIWGAYIKLHGKSIRIGRFTDEKEAARARDTAALKYHGKYARLNNV